MVPYVDQIKGGVKSFVLESDRKNEEIQIFLPTRSLDTQWKIETFYYCFEYFVFAFLLISILFGVPFIA